VSGLVCPPDPTAIARAFDTLYADRALAERLGLAGQKRVVGIGWGQVVAALVGE
jgi:glycosyltransferase involved in cell wall biosynthesis